MAAEPPCSVKPFLAKPSSCWVLALTSAVHQRLSNASTSVSTTKSPARGSDNPPRRVLRRASDSPGEGREYSPCATEPPPVSLGAGRAPVPTRRRLYEGSKHYDVIW